MQTNFIAHERASKLSVLIREDAYQARHHALQERFAISVNATNEDSEFEEKIKCRRMCDYIT
jgi:hypothetical protein